MLRNLALPASVVILMTCGGCYPNRAVYDPYSYAPKSASTTWKPPPSVKPLPLTDDPPELPVQEEPYSLGELIDIALRNNVQTKITWAQARSAAASYGQSQSQFFPAFTGQGTYTRARQPTFFTTAALDAQGNSEPVSVKDFYYTYYGPQLQVSYLVFDFGTLRATSEASRQALYNADWTHNDAILQLLQTIMNDFYNYLYQKQLLVANQANVETAALTLDAATLSLDAGVRDVTDMLQARTQLLQYQTTWAGQQQNLENSYTTLLTNMGVPANQDINVQDLPTDLPEEDIVPPLETLISIGLQNRPDLLAAEANLRSKAQLLRAAKTQFYPQLNYDFNIGKDYFNRGLKDKYNFESTFTLSMPLFQGFYYRNSIKIAEANKKAAEEQVAQSELGMIQQITTYHYNVHIAFETLQFANAFLASAKEQFDISLAQYKQGTNTILNVVSAQNSLADARARQASAIQQWFSTLANLAYATGLLSPKGLAPFEGMQQIELPENQEISNETP